MQGQATNITLSISPVAGSPVYLECDGPLVLSISKATYSTPKGSFLVNSQWC